MEYPKTRVKTMVIKQGDTYRPRAILDFLGYASRTNPQDIKIASLFKLVRSDVWEAGSDIVLARSMKLKYFRCPFFDENKKTNGG